MYIEYCDQINSAYEGIEEILITNNTINIRVNTDTASKLVTEENIEVLIPQSMIPKMYLIF